MIVTRGSIAKQNQQNLDTIQSKEDEIALLLNDAS